MVKMLVLYGKIVSISPLVRVKTKCSGKLVHTITIVYGSTTISITITVKIIIPQIVRIEACINNRDRYYLDCW